MFAQGQDDQNRRPLARRALPGQLAARAFDAFSDSQQAKSVMSRPRMKAAPVVARFEPNLLREEQQLRFQFRGARVPESGGQHFLSDALAILVPRRRDR